jgi:uncharacterized protein
VIRNKTQNTILSENYLSKSAFGKIKGLIGNKTPETIMLKTRFGLHTFLLKFPIDVVILDKHNRIVELKKGLLPNKIYFWNIKFDRVIELPSGVLKKSNTKIGDILEFI